MRQESYCRTHATIRNASSSNSEVLRQRHIWVVGDDMDDVTSPGPVRADEAAAAGVDLITFSTPDDGLMTLIYWLLTWNVSF
jgi:hypothetical protein